MYIYICQCALRFGFDCSPIQFLTSGAGSKAWRGEVNTSNDRGLEFLYDGQGFMSVDLGLSSVEIVFYDVFGRVLHRWSMFKPFLHSIM